MSMQNVISKNRWLYRIGAISFIISLAFILVIYLLDQFSIFQSFRYLLLFSLSLVFSSTLFYIIFKQQNELRAEREQLLTVFQHVSDGIMILDEDKNIIEMNQAARELLGRDDIPDIFCSICEDSNEQLKICDYDKCFLNHNKLSYYEIQLRHYSNKKIPVSISTSNYLGANQQKLTIISIRNLSEYRKGEQSRIHNMVTTSMIKAQEEERKRLSRELHDGIGQSIFSVQLGLEYIIPLISEPEKRLHLENVRKLIKQTLEEIRHMAVELRPSVLDDLGLIAALKSYFKTFGDTFGIQINFEYHGDKERLASNIEIALYRITQEALTNSAKYADTERIDLSLSKFEHEVELRIIDFGKGFSMEDVRRKEKGVGLYNMEERVSMLNGTFHITSQIEMGTDIEVRIPLLKEDMNGY